MRAMAERSDRDAAKRAGLLDAAAQCFMLRGYDATSIDQIADHYGCTKGLVYYHFRSKTELFFEIYRRTMTRIIERASLIARADEPASERLRRMCWAHLHGIINHLADHHVSRQGIESHLTSALTPEQNAELRSLIALRDGYESCFRDVVAEGMNLGTIRSGDASLVARTILAGLNGFSVWYRPRPDQTEKERNQLVEDVLDVILNGVGGANALR